MDWDSRLDRALRNLRRGSRLHEVRMQRSSVPLFTKAPIDKAATQSCTFSEEGWPNSAWRKVKGKSSAQSLMYDLTWQDKKRWRAAGGTERIPQTSADLPVSCTAELLWEEHCVECAVPECYTMCRLYVPRRDKRCARFIYGIYPNRLTSGLFPYGADIRFRRWGKLEAFWIRPPRLVPPQVARRHANWDRWLGRVGNAIEQALKTINSRRRDRVWPLRLRHAWLDHRSSEFWTEAAKPEALYIKFFNPENRSDELLVEGYQHEFVFRTSIPFNAGWTESVISLQDLQLDPSRYTRFLVHLASDCEARLIFTWLDLVQFEAGCAPPLQSLHPAVAAPATKVKCVVWDLDGTLWDGVIGEDGPDRVRPRQAVLDMIRKLDERGILQSIASKNDHDVAWRKIEELGLGNYFLAPSIRWSPKSDSIRAIATELNIGVDTFAFIDDAPFERAEVQVALPDVRVYDPAALGGILERPEFIVPLTSAAALRRLSYLAETERNQDAAKWGTDYDGFLRNCAMTMRVGSPLQGQKARCLELIHRTNQLNLSTRRYTDAEFERLLADSSVECFVLECADRFGEYGIIGFISIDVSSSIPTIVDFVLSCRVAMKRVEQAFLAWYGRRALLRGARQFRAILVQTERNRALRDQLFRFGFQTIVEEGQTELMEIALETVRDREAIVHVEEMPPDSRSAAC
jgi:FkbH-like protein